MARFAVISDRHRNDPFAKGSCKRSAEEQNRAIERIEQEKK
jgi:hypothetical protein